MIRKGSDNNMARFMRNRKGIMAFNVMVMIPRIIFLVIMLVCCVILLSLFLNNKFNITETQAEVLIDGLIYSPGGVSYLDPVTGRMYPEIIDMKQLNGAELDQALFFPGNNIMTARITIGKGRRLLLDPTLSKRVYYNKEWYENWEPLLALANLPGIGGVKKTEVVFPVLIRDESGKLRGGHIEFQVVQPKSVKG